MDKLKNEYGYTLLETLVGIIILGLVIAFFAMFFNQVFANSRIFLIGDATILAKQEIERCINFRIKTDTSYFNNKGNLQVLRDIKFDGELNNAVVTVSSDSGRNEILFLSVMYSQ